MSTATIRLPNKPVHSVDETSELLGVSKWVVYRLIREGRLRAVRLGRRLVVPTDAIVDLLAGE